MITAPVKRVAQASDGSADQANTNMQSRGAKGPMVADKNTTAAAPSSLAPAQPPPPPQDQHGVRFASTVQEISPTAVDNSTRKPEVITAPVHEPAIDELVQGSVSPRQRRASLFLFEPVSLPPSRTTSVEASPREAMASPQHYPAMQSPPLTPSGTGGYPDTRDKMPTEASVVASLREAQLITPQQSTSVDRLSTTDAYEKPVALRPKYQRSASEKLPANSSDQKPSSHRAVFSLGGDGSVPPSRNVSPSRTSPLYSRPITPSGDADGPYSAKHRKSQSPHPHKRSVSPRFRFRDSSTSGRATEPTRRSTPRSTLKPGDVATRTDSIKSGSSKTSSFATLKRFFKRAVSGDGKREPSPPEGRKGSSKSRSSSRGGGNTPFSDDHLEAKYGKIDRMLGSGAGGSVMLMKRDDGRVFAVKEFRQRQPRESKKRYTKKITAEFCVASALRHRNVIETMDIVEVKERWFQVMEFAPYDLFSIVMSGKMSKEEVTCCWLQLLSGVTYLHSCGVAHRDLKLDNVVVTKDGIMKIIDFGSAHVFQYPHETGIQYAEGVVGSDPYMAPEVYDSNTKAYDPRASDIWSLGIIFCCMTLKRFPWRIPQSSQDKSFRLFISPPSAGHDPRRLLLQSKSAVDLQRHQKSDSSGVNQFSNADTKTQDRGREGAPSPAPAQAPANGESSRPGTAVSAAGASQQPRSQSQGPPSQATAATGTGAEKREVISGPWRILRQLPRESRHIVWRMLELEPKRRAKMDEIIRDAWVANADICREMEGGHVVHVPGHTHTLVEAPPPAEKEAARKSPA